jgi:hypothetical protein
MSIRYHYEWVPTTTDGLGEIYALGMGFEWQKRSDLPDDDLVDFDTAGEMTAAEFPPKFAVRRRIG